jgi:hypothetical protein
MLVFEIALAQVDAHDVEAGGTAISPQGMLDHFGVQLRQFDKIANNSSRENGFESLGRLEYSAGKALSPL